MIVGVLSYLQLCLGNECIRVGGGNKKNNKMKWLVSGGTLVLVKQLGS